MGAVVLPPKKPRTVCGGGCYGDDLATDSQPIPYVYLSLDQSKQFDGQHRQGGDGVIRLNLKILVSIDEPRHIALGEMEPDWRSPTAPNSCVISN